VLDNYINQILKFRFAVKDLPLPVYNIFLKVKCHILSDAEILHRIGHDNPQFVANPEKMINSCLAGKYDSCKIKDIDFLMAEIL
jgi:hypothetical protein